MHQRLTAAFLTATFMGLSLAAAQAPPAPATPPAPKDPERKPEKPEKPAAPTPARDGRVDLRPKFELGQVVRYTMKQTSDQQVPNAEDPKNPSRNKFDQSVGLKMTTKAIDKETGEATVEIVYESVKVVIDNPLVNASYDSTKATQPKGKAPKPNAEPDPLDIEGMVLDQYKKMVGTTMTMKQAKDGRIKSITGGASLVPSMPGIDLGMGGSDPSKQFTDLFGPISTNSSTGFDGTAKVGDKWTHSDGVSAGPFGSLDLATTYTLRSHERDVAKVFFSGHAGSASSGGGGGAAMPIGLQSADHTGQYAWDTRKGQLVRCEMEQKVTISGTLTGGKPSTATTTMVLERVDKK